MELVDLALAGGVGGFRLAGEHRGHSLDGLLLPSVDHSLVDAVLGGQMRYRLLPAERLKGHLRLELR